MFDKNRCVIAKGNRRVNIYRKGKAVVLRLRRRWRNGMDKVVAPVEVGEPHRDADEVVQKPTGVVRRVDEPSEVHDQGPLEARMHAPKLSEDKVRIHNQTHCPYECWREVWMASKGKRDHYLRCAKESSTGDEAHVRVATALCISSSRPSLLVRNGSDRWRGGPLHGPRRAAKSGRRRRSLPKVAPSMSHGRRPIC